MSAERLLQIAVLLAGVGVELAYYGMTSAAVYCDMTQREVIDELGRMGGPAAVGGEPEAEELF